MAQKLISLDEAADQLGISKEHLLELRQAGKVAGYRDGASWKFRSEVIDKLASEGIPNIDPGASDLSLDLSDDDLGSGLEEPSAVELADERVEASHADEPVEISGLSGLDLDLAEEDDVVEEAEDKPAPTPAAAESELGLENEEMVAGPASDVDLSEVDEPTVAGLDDEGSDALALDDGDDIDLNTDSILMSEAELGAMGGRPPSTIIGRAELDLDADLDLSPIDKGAASDVKLAGGTSLVPDDDDDILGLDLAGASGNFEGLDELEIDLEAESSRILSPDDVSKAQSAAKAAAKSKGAELSDLGLAPSSSMSGAVSDINITGGSSGDVNLSGLSALELDDEDDEVLGEGSGSDITLSGESSGINIISPSDSGLALDEVALDLSGSAPIGSSLDLGDSAGGDAQTSGIGSALGLGSSLGGGLGSKVGEDFQLTPLGEDDADEEKDSSQVIALDELTEETAGGALPSGFGDPDMMSGDFGGGGLAPGVMPVGATTATELPFSIWNVMSLAGCMLLLALCGMMTFDLLRSMWMWEGV